MLPLRAAADVGRRVGGAVGAGEHGGGLIVAGDALFDGVPVDLAVEANGHVAEVADGGAAVADFDVANRLLARFDAVQEVLVMVLADVESLVGAAELSLDQVGG